MNNMIVNNILHPNCLILYLFNIINVLLLFKGQDGSLCYYFLFIDAYYLNCKRQDQNKNSKGYTGWKMRLYYEKKKKNIYEPHYRDY